jgi:hypothetical protein
MRRHEAAAVIAFWGLLNIVLSTLMFVFTTDLMSHVVYWLANAFVIVMALAALMSREREPGRRRITEASGGTLALASAIAFFAIGAAIGSWAAFVGSALLALAVVLLAMELST